MRPVVVSQQAMQKWDLVICLIIIMSFINARLVRDHHDTVAIIAVQIYVQVFASGLGGGLQKVLTFIYTR